MAKNDNPNIDNNQDPLTPGDASEAVEQKDSSSHTGRKVAVGFLVLLGAILLIIANVAFWARFTLLNTESWVSAVGPLSKDPQVSSSISQYVVGWLFEEYEVKETLEENLPEKVQILSGPMTAAIEDLAVDTVTTVIQSDPFNTVWVGVNRAGHTVIMNVLKGEGDNLYFQNGQLVLDLSDAYNFVEDTFGIENLDLIPQAEEGKLVLFENRQVAIMQEAVSYLDTFGWLMPLLSLLAFASAVLVSLWRRTTLLWIGIVVAIMMAISMIVYSAISSNLMISIADPLLRDLGRAIWQVVTHGYLVQTIFAMFVGILLAIGAWQAAPDSYLMKWENSRKEKEALEETS